MAFRAKNLLPDITADDVRDLFAKVDDRRGPWTIYVTRAGVVWLTDREPPESAKFRWESFRPGAGYVGKKAARDERYVKEQARALIKDWMEGATGYADT